MKDSSSDVIAFATHSAAVGHPLREFFRHGVTAENVAEALATYDFDQPAEAVRLLLEARDFDVAGVRVNGAVAGVVHRDELDEGTCFDHVHELDPALMVSSHAPLAEVIVRLGTSPYVLVSAFGAVAGIVTRADLQKPPVRMWLFGLLTMVEDLLGRALRRRFPDDAWRASLSPARIERALALQAERRRRHESLDLVDCLSFGDKWWILSKDEGFLRAAGWESRALARERMKELEQLRNRLAHAQDVTTATLPTMVRIASQLERILNVTSSS